MTALAVRTLLTLFVVLNPIGLAPFFVALAGARPAAEQSHIARKAVLVAGGVLLTFWTGGEWLIRHLGITLDAFRVAGGLLLFRIAVGMLFAKEERRTDEEEAEAKLRSDIAVFPLAIPMIAGPGAVASVMILAGEAHAYRWGAAIVPLALASVLWLNYVSLRISGWLTRLMGKTGVNVITRVLGLLLAALAVQYVADGARILLRAAS
jgi:multiple antibiotic resistance protein